jgi:small conductance mechanosensitive channel
VVIGATIVDAVLRGLVSAIGQGLSRWSRLEAHHRALPEVVKHLRTALRAVVVGVAAVLVTTTLEVPPGAQRTIAFTADVIGALYVSRAASRLWRLVTDVLFGMSGVFAKLEGPLKALGNLKHLRGVTKRVGDYLVYVGAATWVAGQTAADAWYYNVGQIGLRLIVIFYASRVLVEVCVLLVQEMFIGKPEEHTEGETQRRRTLLPVIVGFLRYGIYFMALIIGLKEASIDPTPLLAGAGVIGVAIGFGAQTFVGDIVAGFFILFEDLVLVGDLVEVGSVKGEIEEIGVRISRIRTDAGVLHCIPNGELRKVANHSRKHVNAVVDVHVSYEEDPRHVRDVLSAVAEQVLREEGVSSGPVQVKVQELTEKTMVLRVIACVPPGRDDDLSDVLRARVVEELRAAKVGAPRPRRAIIIDNTLQVRAPPEGQKEEAKAVEPLKPKEASE